MTGPDGTRRALLAGLSAALAAAGIPRRAAAAGDAAQQVALLERETGGRIGLAAINTATGRRLVHRADERFAMCSTFKLMLAAAVLSRIEAQELSAAQRVSYTRANLLAHSAVTEAHVAEGALPLEVLLQAVIEVSDNTAANLLLGLIGGPPGYTGFVRGLGDSITRLDRIEMALNSNLPGDPRDTTSPGAMLADMKRVLIDPVLTAGSRERLLGWMRDCRTGRERLRARLPAGWSAGDKTGTGDRGAANDLAIFRPPRGAPVLVACYMSDSGRPAAVLESAHARVGALVAAALG